MKKGGAARKGIFGLLMFFFIAIIIVWFGLHWFLPRIQADQVISTDLIVALLTGIFIGVIITSAVFIEIRK